MRILVAMQHALTAAQHEELKLLGVTETLQLREVNPSLFNKLASMPASVTEEEIRELAEDLVSEARAHGGVILPIGHPSILFLMGQYVKGGCKALFSLSERRVKEVHNVDGTVTKTAVFEHVKFLTFEL